jgi:hypothetical protein
VQEKQTRIGTTKRFFETNNAVTSTSWALSTIANALALTITIMYWIVLYHPEEHINYTFLEHYDNFDVHLVQTLITLIDVVTSSRPWRFCHAYLSVAFSLVYVAFNIFYVLGLNLKNRKGQDFIYPILDWRSDPGKAVVWVGVAMIIMIVSQGMLCLLSYTRDKVWKWWTQKLADDAEIFDLT